MKQETLSHEKIINLLKENGRIDLHGGVQLFADQYDKDWSISVNFSGTGLHISMDEIDTNELLEDEVIRVYRTWTYKYKDE